jgi:hypothetical protein
MAGPFIEIFFPQQRFLSQESRFLTKYSSLYHPHMTPLCHPDGRPSAARKDLTNCEISDREAGARK